jgi:hypothetical protein
MDYAFSERVFGMIEYHLNGAGSSDPDNYLTQFDDTAYTAGGVFLLGTSYLIPSISWQASTLLTLSLTSLTNLDDSSAFLNLSADYSLSDNLYMGMGYHHFTGPDFNAFPNASTSIQNQLQLGSEYGSNPNSVYVSLRYYF